MRAREGDEGQRAREGYESTRGRMEHIKGEFCNITFSGGSPMAAAINNF